MKKIIVSFLVSLVCFFGYAQTPYPTPNPFGSKGTMTQAQGGWKIDSTAIMPVYADTFAANRSKTSLYPGSLIRVSDDYYYRSADTSKWLLLAITTSNCAGTQLISGSITWSGSGLVYDATDLDYYILCSRYFANSTTLTLAVADPTNPRIDKFYADITGAIGVITGTPATNPQEPQVNPLNQIDLGFVYIPAGSTVPAGTTQTVIYNENVEWSGTSDVPSINFAYATNPYIGSLSTYIPNAPNSSYVEWQSNGIDYLFSEAQYLKFWVRLNDNFVSDPLSFFDVTFEYTDVTVSQTLAVGNGDYNMDYSLINQWQLVSIPLTGITTFGTEFNEVHFVINSAPTSFQLDYVYLLETATIPPAPVGGTWLLNGNSAINDVTQYIGTRDAKKLNFGTNGQIRAYIDTAGIDLLIDDTTANVMLIDSNGKIRKTYQPTILADAPLYIYTDSNNKRHIADTSATAGGNCGLISGGEVTLIDSTTFNVSAALYCIGNVNYSSLDSVMTLVTPGDTVRIDVIGVDTSGSVFKLTGVEAENPSPPSVDATYQLVLSFVLVSTDSITPYNPQLSWSTGGNLWTNSSNFIGTKDNVSLRFRVNNVNAGQLNVTNFSTGFGVETLNSNLGARNNAFGWNAGFSNTTGTDNNSHGHASLYSNQTGNANNAYGYSSLYLNTGSENNAFGYRALAQSVSGTMNTAMGDSSLITLTTGSRNTAIGANADVATSSTDSSVAIGFEAVATTRQLAFSPHLNTMFLNLDSASGTAPAIAGIDENGNWRKYATPSGGSSILTGNVTYVDAVNGNDGTATLGDFTKPFLTVGAAITAATAGYTIVVRPGVYSNETNLLKDSVDWYFMPNTKVSQSITAIEGMFQDGTEVVSRITGYGVFIDTLGARANILNVSNSSSNIYFEAQSLLVGNGDINSCIYIADGTSIVNIKGSLGGGTISSSSYDAVIITGGTLNLTADKIISTGTSEGNAIEIAGGTANIKCMEYRTTGAYDAFGSTSAISFSGGNATIEGEGVSELSDGLVAYNNASGTLTLRGKLTTSVKTPIVYLATESNKKIINQATLISADTYSVSAASAKTIVSYGSFANKAVDANITINGILTIGSYVQ